MERGSDHKNASAATALDAALPAPSPAVWTRNQLTVYISTALIFGGFTVVMPFLPLYVKQLGITEMAGIALWSGVLISVTPMLAAVLGPFWGKLGDRYGLKIMAERV